MYVHLSGVNQPRFLLCVQLHQQAEMQLEQQRQMHARMEAERQARAEEERKQMEIKCVRRVCLHVRNEAWLTPPPLRREVYAKKAQLQEKVNAMSLRLTQLNQQFAQLSQKKEQLSGMIVQGKQATDDAARTAADLTAQVAKYTADVAPMEANYTSTKAQLDQARLPRATLDGRGRYILTLSGRIG